MKLDRRRLVVSMVVNTTLIGLWMVVSAHLPPGVPATVTTGLIFTVLAALVVGALFVAVRDFGRGDRAPGDDPPNR